MWHGVSKSVKSVLKHGRSDAAGCVSGQSCEILEALYTLLSWFVFSASVASLEVLGIANVFNTHWPLNISAPPSLWAHWTLLDVSNLEEVAHCQELTKRLHALQKDRDAMAVEAIPVFLGTDVSAWVSISSMMLAPWKPNLQSGNRTSLQYASITWKWDWKWAEARTAPLLFLSYQL